MESAGRILNPLPILDQIYQLLALLVFYRTVIPLLLHRSQLDFLGSAGFFFLWGILTQGAAHGVLGDTREIDATILSMLNRKHLYISFNIQFYDDRSENKLKIKIYKFEMGIDCMFNIIKILCIQYKGSDFCPF